MVELSRSIHQSPNGAELPMRIRRWLPSLGLLWLLIFWWLFFTSDLPNLSAFVPDRLAVLSYLVFADSPVDTNSSIESLAERVPILFYALAVVLSGIAIGRIILRRLRLTDQFDNASASGFAGGLGLSVISLFTLGVGWFGLLNRLIFVIALALPIGVEVIETKRSGLRTTPGSGRTPAQTSWKWMITSLLVCAPFLLVMLLGAMLPSTDFDVKEYHLEGPKEYFLAGRIQFLPHNVYTSFPFLTEMLSLCGMVISDDWWTGALVGKTVLCSFALFTACGVFAVAKRISGTKAGWLAAVCYLTMPWVFRISTIAYTEGAACCYVILTFLAFVLWREQLLTNASSSSQPTNAAALVGLLAGNSIATKYPGLVLVMIPVALAMASVALFNINRRRDFLKHILAFGVGVCVTFGPWAIKNTIETGNPVYPLGYSIFGGADWDKELNIKWQKGHSRPTPVFKAPSSMLADFAGNMRDVTYRHDWLSPLLYGLAPFALVLAYRHKEMWLLAAAGFWILAAWYTLTHLIDRFWVPVLPIFAALAGVGGSQLIEILFSWSELDHAAPFRFSRRLTGSVLAILLAGSVLFNFGMISSHAGFVGNSAFFLPYEISRDAVKPASIRIAESVMEPGDRVLYVGEAQVFDAEIDLRYNTVFDYCLLEQMTSTSMVVSNADGDHKVWKLNSPEVIRQHFAEAGITHVLINWREIVRYRTTYGYTDFVSPKRISELAEIWPFAEVRLNPLAILEDWDRLSESQQAEIDRWGPELKIIQGDGSIKVMDYQLFALAEHAPRAEP